MSILVLLSLPNEVRAREALECVLRLHANVLLTLDGCVLVTGGEQGRFDVVETAPERPGVEKVTESPVFPPLLASLRALAAAPEDGAVPVAPVAAPLVVSEHQPGVRRRLAELLDVGHWGVILLASTVAEGEVSRQLDSLDASRLDLDITPEDETLLLLTAS